MTALASFHTNWRALEDIAQTHTQGFGLERGSKLTPAEVPRQDQGYTGGYATTRIAPSSNPATTSGSSSGSCSTPTPSSSSGSRSTPSSVPGLSLDLALARHLRHLSAEETFQLLCSLARYPMDGDVNSSINNQSAISNRQHPMIDD